AHRPLVVFGGGHLGGAVARHAAATGSSVIVASPTPRAHPALWRRWSAGDTLRIPMEDATVCIALSPRVNRDAPELWGHTVARLAASAWRQGATAVTVCGPAGQGEPGLDAFERGMQELRAAPRTTVVRFGPLYGTDDACIWPIVSAIRQSGVARLPRGTPPSWPLLLDDAARAVMALVGAPGEHVLRGPERLGMNDIGDAITRRFGGRWAWRWWGGPPQPARLKIWAEMADSWDDARMGPRQTIATWVGKLPGLRRKR
ncbi:MAG: hypothetical protein Q8P41_24865, partial [Pseudomonadota bacterium]|nr:hypothetical protein [Pseudomonadota bacterium]